MPQRLRDYYLSHGITSQAGSPDQGAKEGPSAIWPFSAISKYNESDRQSIIAALKQQPANRGFQGLWHRLQYGFGKLRKLIPQRGFIITFSGVEGVGTHTVIEATGHRISEELRLPVIVLPQRPGLLPAVRRTERSGNTVSLSPETISKRRGFVASLRFVYAHLDSLLAQCYIHLRYVMRGYVVLYDHYFDFSNDNEGNNVVLPAAFTTWWYRFLLKPDLNFLLYAPADVILQRKQELRAQDIEQLTGQYLALFQKLERRSGPGHYISVRNMRLGDTVERLFQHIKTQAEAAA
jgi:thymidylate kinase